MRKQKLEEDEVLKAALAEKRWLGLEIRDCAPNATPCHRQTHAHTPVQQL